MTKEIKLHGEYSYDFVVFGITTSSKDYKLAWLLNNVINIGLTKMPNHVVELKNSKHIEMSNYSYTTEHGIVRLLENRTFRGKNQNREFMVPELKHFDFFLVKEGTIDNSAAFSDRLKTIEEVEYIAEIDVESIKSKENFLF